MIKNIYWIKKEIWCAYPFNQEIDRRYIEFYTKAKYGYKNKLPFTCDSLIINKERVEFVAKELGMNPKNIKLISIKTHNSKKYKNSK